MKKFIVNIFIITLCVFCFSSCEVDVEEKIDQSTYTVGTVDAGELNTEGFTVKSLLESVNLGHGKFNVLTFTGDLPQIITVNNAEGYPVLMYRDIVPKKGSIEINAQTTAIALLTFRPDVGIIAGDDYTEFLSMITSSEYFDNLLSAVEQSIANNRSIYDTTNLQLISAAGAVLRDVMGDTNRLYVGDAPKGTSLLTTLYGCWPIDVRAQGKSLQFRTPACCPSYWCTVYNENAQVERSFWIPTRENFGVLNGVLSVIKTLRGEGDWLYGETVTYTFPNVNDRRDFFITRDNPAMIADHWIQITQCLLQCLGIPIKSAWLTTISSAIQESMTFAANGSWGDHVWNFVPVIIDATLDCLEKHGIEIMGNAVSQMILFNKIVNATEGLGNALLRAFWLVNTEKDFNFCAQCYSNNEFGFCRDCLRIIKGNNQIGKPNTRLKEPISVEIVTENYDDLPDKFYKVRFEAADGSGYLSESVVYPDENGIATTNWTLGREDATQTVDAILTDYLHDIDLDTVTFTATLEQNEWVAKDRCAWAGDEYAFTFTLDFGYDGNFGPTTVYGYDFDGKALKCIYSGNYSNSSKLVRMQLEKYTTSDNHHFRTDSFEGYLTGDHISLAGSLIYDDGAGCSVVVDLDRVSPHSSSKSIQMTDSTSRSNGCALYIR